MTQRVRDHEPAPTPAEEDATTAAVFAALFGLGRLQGWVNDPEVENIDVNGCDQVWISYADGRLVRAPAVADSDGELIEMVQSFAAYLGQSAREFSSARPLLNLRLPDGSRLCAWMAVTPRPGLSIRRHRLTDIGLEELEALGSIDAGLLAFLRAAVHARKNIVVTGGVNAGKTTLVRALANEFDPYERVVVVEKEYELALDRLPERHHQVVCIESRDANAEGSGEVTLATLVVHALRMNPQRIICGEVHRDLGFHRRSESRQQAGQPGAPPVDGEQQGRGHHVARGIGELVGEVAQRAVDGLTGPDPRDEGGTSREIGAGAPPTLDSMACSMPEPAASTSPSRRVQSARACRRSMRAAAARRPLSILGRPRPAAIANKAATGHPVSASVTSGRATSREMRR